MLIHEEITSKILASAFEVSNNLGAGFLEKAYENALIIELQNQNLEVEAQKKCTIFYKGNDIGQYQTDIIVNDKVIIEVKSVERINSVHIAQLINYLKITGLEVGLILNFGNPKVEFKRICNG